RGHQARLGSQHQLFAGYADAKPRRVAGRAAVVVGDAHTDFRIVVTVVGGEAQGRKRASRHVFAVTDPLVPEVTRSARGDVEGRKRTFGHDFIGRPHRDGRAASFLAFVVGQASGQNECEGDAASGEQTAMSL